MKKFTAFMLCLFLVLSVLAAGLAGEVTAAEKEEFIVPKVVPAQGILPKLYCNSVLFH